MKIQVELQQTDIEQAIALLLRERGFQVTEKDFEAKFTAGRKGNGLSASVAINSGPAETGQADLFDDDDDGELQLT